MASENTETAPKRRVFICLPKHLQIALSHHYNLEHGLFITELNPYINERYLATYFKEWGCVTMSKIKNDSSCSKAYVRFYTAAEADIADWAGPHYIGGTECKARRVVSPKCEDEPENEVIPVQTKAPRRRPLGLGYMLEDPQWLDDVENEQTNPF